MNLLKMKRIVTIVLAAVFSAQIIPFSGQVARGNPYSGATESQSMDSEQAAEQVTPSIVVHIHLSGVLSESEMPDALGLTAGQITSLRSLTDLMDKADKDEKVKAVILTYDGLSLGFGQLQEIADSITKLKEAGKKVYVHAEEMDIFDYTLLCAGSNLSVAPQSELWLIGIYAESVYVKDLLDKIGVQGDFMHMGDYKSAAEIFTRSQPSKPAEENINWLLDSYYDSLINMISHSRAMSGEQIRELIDNGPYIATEAKEKGLIDAVETQEEFITRVKQELGGQVKIDNHYGQEQKVEINLANPFAFFGLLAEMMNPPQKPHKNSVALIYVEGMIMPGYSQPSLFGVSEIAFSGNIRKALETAAKDDSVKAVVMRVDSPGGSAEASEVILNATKQLKDKKPFIVSMGDVAGSGGYYISCGADTIFADEVTVTASIGVVGGKLVTADLWNKLGVNWVGYKRGANADFLGSLKSFDDSQKQKLSDYMQNVYEVFKNHVAKGRSDRLTRPLDQIAGGRVYTGKQALELGLVDKIGGLNQAIDYAVSKAELEDYEVRVIPRPKDFITMLLEEYTGQSESPTDISMPDATSLFSGNPSFKSLFELLRKTEPRRAEALYQALMRIELFRRENVIMMMPFDIIFN